MTRPLYRIYLAPDHLGHLQQTPRHTRDFYDIDTSQFQISPKTRWYRIVQTSPGRVFTELWRAGGPCKLENVTIARLGAFMRLSGNLWYVDGRDLQMEDARNLHQSAFTRPKAFALLLALIVVLYCLTTNLFSDWGGQPIPHIQPLARFVGFTMLFLVAAEHLLYALKRWKRQLPGHW